MYLSAYECYLTEKLNCGVADLDMLDNLYSKLGEDCVDTEEVVRDTNNLNELLSELYYSVTSKVADEIRNIADSKETLYLQVRENGEEVNKDVEITPYIEEQLNKVADDLDYNNNPYCNFLDTHFQNELDQTVDWTETAYTNAIELIQYLINHGEILIEEEEEENLEQE